MTVFFGLRKTEPKWIREVRIHLVKMGLNEDGILYRHNIKKQVNKFKGF